MDNFQVGCATCEASGSTIMVQPGRVTCLGTGWKLLYQGWLMGRIGAGKQSLCITKMPKSYGTSSNRAVTEIALIEVRTSKYNSVLFVFIGQTAIDDPNSPITALMDGQELLCAVCIK